MNLPNMPELKDGVIKGNDKSKYVLSFIFEYTSPLNELLKFSTKSLKENFRSMHEERFSKDIEIEDVLGFVDEFIHEMPAWPTKVYRGVSIDEDELVNYIENHSNVSMNGLSSWTTEKDIAVEYSKGSGDVEVLYVLDNNKSGCNISHLSMFYDEREILAPSNVRYEIMDIDDESESDKKRYVIYLKELEVQNA